MAANKNAKKVNRNTRIRKAKAWVATFQGSDLVGAYSKRFRIDLTCAQKDLEAMKASTPEQRKELKQAHDIREQKERDEKVASLMKKTEKRKIGNNKLEANPAAMQKALKEAKAGIPKQKQPKQRCENCGRAMKQQFIGLKHCKCGTSWSKANGYFERTPNMVFALQRKVIKKGKNSIRTKQVPIIRINTSED
jgi:hypothetical protein